jgi:hypothetical protein
MLVVLLCLAFSDGTVGSVPLNLYVNDENFSGSWELSSHSVGFGNRLFLIPADSPDRMGYAWRLRKSPHEVWSASVTLEVNDTISLLRGGLFVTEEFGCVGEHFGGFAKFQGGAAIFEVVNRTLSVEYRVCDGRFDYSNSTIMPHHTAELRSDTFTLTLNFTMRSMLTVSYECADKSDVVYFGRSRIGNPKAWFSINVHAPTPGVEVAISRIEMSYQDSKPSPGVPERSPAAAPAGFDPASQLTHSDFGKLSRVIVDSREGAPVESGQWAVFDGLLEIDRVVEKSSKVWPTKQAIENAMHNYTDAWKRRSLRMIGETEMLKFSLKSEVAVAGFLLEDFKWNIAREVSELKSQAKGFADGITEGISDIAIQTAEMARAERGVAPVLVRGLIAIGIAEVVALAIYGAKRRRRSR